MWGGGPTRGHFGRIGGCRSSQRGDKDKNNVLGLVCACLMSVAVPVKQEPRWDYICIINPSSMTNYICVMRLAGGLPNQPPLPLPPSLFRLYVYPFQLLVLLR